MPHEEIAYGASYDKSNPYPLQVFVAEHHHDAVGMRTVHFADADLLGSLFRSEGNQSEYPHHGNNDGKHGEEQQHAALLVFLGVVLVQGIGKELITEFLDKKVVTDGHLFIFLLYKLQCFLPMPRSNLDMYILQALGSIV